MCAICDFIHPWSCLEVKNVVADLLDTLPDLINSAHIFLFYFSTCYSIHTSATLLRFKFVAMSFSHSIFFTLHAAHVALPSAGRHFPCNITTIWVSPGCLNTFKLNRRELNTTRSLSFVCHNQKSCAKYNLKKGTSIQLY
jgi:hypothetical protein